MGDRDRVLDALPEGRGGGPPVGDVAIRSVPLTALWDAFVDRLTALGGEIHDISDLAEFSGRALCDRDVPPSIQELLAGFQGDLWQAEAGVTLAEFAVAETGSIVLTATEGRSRLLSLAPPIHVALVDPAKTVASLDEAIARLGDETSVIVSGPSRTADVEGVMVMGVHGPRRLWVVPLNPKTA